VGSLRGVVADDGGRRKHHRRRENAGWPVTGASRRAWLTWTPRSQPGALCRCSVPDLMDLGSGAQNAGLVPGAHDRSPVSPTSCSARRRGRIRVAPSVQMQSPRRTPSERKRSLSCRLSATSRSPKVAGTRRGGSFRQRSLLLSFFDRRSTKIRKRGVGAGHRAVSGASRPAWSACARRSQAIRRSPEVCWGRHLAGAGTGPCVCNQGPLCESRSGGWQCPSMQKYRRILLTDFCSVAIQGA